MSKKGFAKGLATGAVLTAIGALIVTLRQEKNQATTKQLHAAAHATKDKVLAHAKKLGGITRDAYDKIVDATVVEYRDVKSLSTSDLTELKEELKAQWSTVKDIVESRVTKAVKKPAKKAKKKA